MHLGIRNLTGAVVALALAATAMALSAGTADATVPSNYLVQYDAHVQDIGWQSPAFSDGQIAGTVGQNRRMEAMTAQLNPATFGGAHICYQATELTGAVQQSYCDGQVAGTTGLSLAMEAVRIELSGAPGWSVCYSAQMQYVGWLPEVCDGQSAGTLDGRHNLEALTIHVKHHLSVHVSNATTGRRFDAGWVLFAGYTWHQQTTSTLDLVRDDVTGQWVSAYIAATTHSWSTSVGGFHGLTHVAIGPAYAQTPDQATGVSGYSTRTFSWTQGILLSAAITAWGTDGTNVYQVSTSTF